MKNYAMPGYQLSQRDTYQNQGISVFSMIFDTNWIITTIKVLFVPQDICNI